MLVSITDADGRETWINPIHVKLVRTRGKLLGMGGKGTEVWFSFNNNSEAVYFTEDPADIAARLNAGMPSAVLIDTSDDDQPQHQPHSSN